MSETLNREKVVRKLLDYLNRRIVLAELVDWAENALVDSEFEPEDDSALLMDVLTYVGASDSPDFPLTWDMISHFLDKLGAPVRVELTGS